MQLSRRSILAAAGSLVPAAAWAAESATYAFAVTRNRPWAAVQLDDKDPLAFLIDTGSTDFGVLAAKAREMNLRNYGRGNVQAAVGRERVTIYGASVTLGGAVRETWLPVFGIERLPRPLEGIIPLARFRVMGVNFDTKQVLITSKMPKDLEGYEPLTLDAGEAAAGSIDRMGALSTDDNNLLLKDHRPIIEAEFDGEQIKLMVDTGSSGGLFLFPRYVKRRGLWDHFPNHQADSITTAARSAKVRIVRAERLKIGKLVFANPLVTLGDPADSAVDGGRTAAGLVGMEFLRRLNFVSDPQRRKLWVKPNAAITDGYRHDRAGADVDFEDNVARVVELIPGSPADRAGLKLGDKVTGWRGKDGLDGLSWALKGAPGSTVEIQVERDGKNQMISVVLQELI